MAKEFGNSAFNADIFEKEKLDLRNICKKEVLYIMTNVRSVQKNYLHIKNIKIISTRNIMGFGNTNADLKFVEKCLMKKPYI